MHSLLGPIESYSGLNRITKYRFYVISKGGLIPMAFDSMAQAGDMQSGLLAAGGVALSKAQFIAVWAMVKHATEGGDNADQVSGEQPYAGSDSGGTAGGTGCGFQPAYPQSSDGEAVS